VSWFRFLEPFPFQIDFLVHDGRLYGGIDVRQRATLFKIARDITEQKGLQYIATINEDLLDVMKDQFTEQEYKDCIESRIVLRLTDDGAASKLLGIQVDMHYDNDEP
jgi:uncharacterized protein YydD (DUF2326 family)